MSANDEQAESQIASPGEAAPTAERKSAAKPRGDRRSPLNQRRHQAREMAVQVLYEVDVTEHGADEVLARTRAQHEMHEEAFGYLSVLVRGIGIDSERIDGHIGAAAPAFPVAQLPPVDRNVLRVAVFELLNQQDVPPKVAINEAIDLAKRYGGDNSGKFVNGVLGTVFSRIAAERAKTTSTSTS